MTTITFILPDGSTRSIAAVPGVSLMKAATSNLVPGIVAECGGNASCATCHVYLVTSDPDLICPDGSVEDEMLDFTAAPRRTESRLSCQVEVTEHLDGMVIEVPAAQV
ncbi:MAG TPA: 2Fe-2S iron-sulfur cluster-binding protein [Kineosporiaceae bacterium]|nr:2Fe-2S iron-sulfur cluster-binding protein [Kineosporiaceae bacterium]